MKRALRVNNLELYFLNNKRNRTTKPSKIVHSDVCDPMKTISMGGVRYFLAFIDKFLRKVWVYMLKAKRECLETFEEFKVFVATLLKHNINVFWSSMIKELF